MVIFPIDCFIFHVTKTDFLQFLRPEHMICSYCDPWLMDGKDSKHNRRVWGFFFPLCSNSTTDREDSWKQTLVPKQAILQHVYYGNKLYCFKRDSVLGHKAEQKQMK